MTLDEVKNYMSGNEEDVIKELVDNLFDNINDDTLDPNNGPFQSFSLLKEVLINQIEQRMFLNRANIDTISIIEDRLNLIQSISINNDNYVLDVQSKIQELYTELLGILQTKLGIVVNDTYLHTLDTLKVIVNSVYSFLVLEYYNNLKIYFIQYILNHKAELTNMFKPKNKKGIEYSVLQKRFKDPELSVLVYKLDDILNIAIEHAAELPLELIRTIVKNDPDEVDNTMMYKYLLNSEESNPLLELSDNFIDCFFKPIVTSKANKDTLLNDVKLILMQL